MKYRAPECQYEFLPNLFGLNQLKQINESEFEGLFFEKIEKEEFEKYVIAVQNCANKDYMKMIELITSIFPD